MRSLVSLCLLTICLAGTGQAGVQQGKGYTEDPVLVERVVWPVLIQPMKRARESGVCDRLGPADILLTEDGVPRPIKVLDRRSLGQMDGGAGINSPIHALLIDTSVSMKISERLEHAKEAAIRYIKQLPGDERVLVAGFDDSLVLLSPPTLDRELLEAAIRKIELGNYTALWDALAELVRYLEWFPVQKTVVLLSDGDDSSSMGDMATKEILERVGGRPDLAIFPIGVDLDSHSNSDEFRSVLRRIASATGGLSFETSGVMGVDRAFERLHRHLDRRFYATYEPLEPVSGREAGAKAGERRVRVAAKKGTPCKVQSAGPPTRIEFSPRDTAALPPGAAWEAVSAFASLGECLNLPSPRSVIHEVRLPMPEGWPGIADEPPTMYVLDPPGLMAVRTPDVVLERGLLYSRKAYEKNGRYRSTIDRKPSVRTRTVAIEVPEFEHLRRAIRGPEEVLIHLLQNDRCPAGATGRDAKGDADRADWRHPLFVHGKTFLEIREFVAQALYEHYGEYRDWARERLVAEAQPRVDALLAELEESQGLPAERLAGVRSTLMADAATPDREAPQRFLAEWLGDVSARDAVQALEARLAEALLDPLGRGDEIALAANLERRGFGVLLDWFPPANQVRVLAPLLPAYDVARNVIGFYRIILPRPRVGRPPADPIPPEPFGLRTARFLLNAEVWDADHSGGLRLDAVQHLVEDEPHHHALVQQLKQSGRYDVAGDGRGTVMQGVMLDFVDQEIDGAFLELMSLFGADTRVPRLISGCLVGDASTAMDGLLERLTEHAAYRQLSCAAKDNANDERLRRVPTLR